MSALCLEAVNDSEEELTRISKLAELGDEDAARSAVNASNSNWDNARKIIRSFAEQIGDIERDGQRLVLPNSGASVARPSGRAARHSNPQSDGAGSPDGSSASSGREVTSETIALAGLDAASSEPPAPLVPTEAEISATVAARINRLSRHNRLVRAFAASLARAGATLREFPYDCHARRHDDALLVEAKSLDGGLEDERERVRECFSQLHYYLRFQCPPDPRPVLVALFDAAPSAGHVAWFNEFGAAVVWTDGRRWRRSGGEQSPLLREATELDVA